MIELPLGRCCKKCGYLLQGLPNPSCPECGRVFDPSDPTTYDASPRTARRRKWLTRLSVVGVAALLLFAFFPRGIIVASAKIACTHCGRGASADRWQFIPPAWFPFRYPGWTSSNQLTASSTGPCDHVYRSALTGPVPRDLLGRADPKFAVLTRRGTEQPGLVDVCDGIEITPPNTAVILKRLTDSLGNDNPLKFDLKPRPSRE